MKGESYKNVNAYFSQTKARNTTIKALHDILPLVMYIFYPIQLLTLAINEGIGSELFLKFTLIPLCTLILARGQQKYDGKELSLTPYRERFHHRDGVPLCQHKSRDHHAVSGDRDRLDAYSVRRALRPRRSRRRRDRHFHRHHRILYLLIINRLRLPRRKLLAMTLTEVEIATSLNTRVRSSQ